MQDKPVLTECCGAPYMVGTELGDLWKVCSKCQELIEKLDPELGTPRYSLDEYLTVREIREGLDREILPNPFVTIEEIRELLNKE